MVLYDTHKPETQERVRYEYCPFSSVLSLQVSIGTGWTKLERSMILKEQSQW
jgi:hypothetical protein